MSVKIIVQHHCDACETSIHRSVDVGLWHLVGTFPPPDAWAVFVEAEGFILLCPPCTIRRVQSTPLIEV